MFKTKETSWKLEKITTAPKFSKRFQRQSALVQKILILKGFRLSAKKSSFIPEMFCRAARAWYLRFIVWA